MRPIDQNILSPILEKRRKYSKYYNLAQQIGLLQKFLILRICIFVLWKLAIPFQNRVNRSRYNVEIF